MSLRNLKMSKQAQKEYLAKPGVHVRHLCLWVIDLWLQQASGVRGEFGFRKLIRVDRGIRLREHLNTSSFGSLRADAPDLFSE